VAEDTCIASKIFCVSPSSFSRIFSCNANARVASEFFWAKAAVFDADWKKLIGEKLTRGTYEKLPNFSNYQQILITKQSIQGQRY